MSGASLREAAAQGDEISLCSLLRGGANPCSADKNGLVALHYAVWNGHLRCVEILAVNDLGVPTRFEDEMEALKQRLRGEVPSAGPAAGVKRGMVSCLNLATKAGWTALHIAAMGAREGAASARILLHAGCDARIRDKNGLTPAEVAAVHEHDDLAALLGAPRPAVEDRRLYMEDLCKQHTLVFYKFRQARPCDEVWEAEAVAMSKQTEEVKLRRESLRRESLRRERENEARIARQRRRAVEHGGRAAVEDYVKSLHHHRKVNHIRVPPMPPGILIPEEKILEYATDCFKGPRGARVIRNLVATAHEAELAAKRREEIARRQLGEPEAEGEGDSRRAAA